MLQLGTSYTEMLHPFKHDTRHHAAMIDTRIVVFLRPYFLIVLAHNVLYEIDYTDYLWSNARTSCADCTPKFLRQE